MLDDLVEYRLSMAHERLKSAELLLQEGQYKDSIGRSYYALFTAVRALLATEGIDYSKHSGVIQHFQRYYIKTGVFDVKYSAYVQNAFQIRNSCDYDDFYIVSKQNAQEQYTNAEELLRVIEDYVVSKDNEH